MCEAVRWEGFQHFKTTWIRLACSTLIHTHNIHTFTPHSSHITPHTYHTFSITLLTLHIPHTTLPHTSHSLTHHTPHSLTHHTSYPNGWNWCDCWSADNPLHKVQRSSGVTDPCDHLPPPHPSNAYVSGSLSYAGPSRGDSRISRGVSVWVCVGGCGWVCECGM